MFSQPLRVIATTDLHGGHQDMVAAQTVALPQVARVIRDARVKRFNVLLDNGDNVLGSPFAAFVGHHERPDNPIGHWLRTMRFDAVNVGNEDLRNGYPWYERLVAHHVVPAVSTNLRYPRDSGISRVRVLRYGAIKVGIVGVTPSCTRRYLGGTAVEVRCLRTAVQDGVAQLRAANCAAVLVLAHTGIGPARTRPDDEQCARDIARMPGVDIVIAGHLHETRIEQLNGGALIVAPGSHGRCVAVVDLVVSGTSRARIESATLVDTHEAIADRRTSRMLRPHVVAFKRHIRQRIATSPQSITTEFAPLMRPSFIRWVEACFIRAAGKTSRANRPPIAVTSCPGGRAPLTWIPPRRRLTERCLYELVPFDNALVCTRATGAQLASLVEHTHSIFSELDVGTRRAQDLFVPDIPLFDYNFFSGMTWDIDLRAPTGRRVRSIRVMGTPLESSHTYRLLMTDYAYSQATRAHALSSATELAPSVRALLRDGIPRADAQPSYERPKVLASRDSTLTFRVRRSPRTRVPPGFRLLDAEMGLMQFMPWEMHDG